MMHSVFHADPFQGSRCQFFAFAAANAAINQGLLNVFQGRRARQQIEALKHKSDVPVANPGQFQFGHLAHIGAI